MSPDSPVETTPIIRVEGLRKSHGDGEHRREVLRGLDFTVSPQEFVSICGPSGCGKTTLLNLIGALDRPDDGLIVVDGLDLGELDESGLARYRRERIGFVFQSFNLLPTLSAIENVEAGLEGHGLSARERRERATHYLERVGLGDSMGNFPSQLSGGEQQRTGVARAIAREPALVLADEPTGNLDEKTGRDVFQMLLELQSEHGLTLVMVTHNPDLAAKTDRILRIANGLMAGQGPGGSGS